MNVRDYVRIKNEAGWCCIGKIVNINEFREPDMKYCIDIQGEDYIFVPEDMIAKSSPNIIDIIEVGDIITTNNLCGEITKIDNDKIYTTCYDGEYCSASDIKSIVTKEEFKEMEYKL